MVGATLNFLDQIARYFILPSDAPLYWFRVSSLQSSAREKGGANNDDSSTQLVNDEHNNTPNDGGNRQRWWAVAFDNGIVGVRQRRGSGENGV